MTNTLELAPGLAAVLALADEANSQGIEIPKSESLVMHVEAKSPEAAAGVIGRLNSRFADAAMAKPLFDSGEAGEAQRFIELRFDQIHEELAAPVAYAAAYELADSDPEIITVEPDLPSSLYIEPGEPITDRSAAESAIVKKFCEVDDTPPEPKTWAIDLIRVKEAMAYSGACDRPAGGQGIRVAQPDTGVRPNPYLPPASLEAGWDVIADDSDPYDPFDDGNPGHGTATGSCVIGNNDTVHGSAPNAKLYPIRAIKAVVIVHAGPVAKAIERAIAAEAHVVTMSLGGVPSRAVRAILKRARDKGLIVLAAAGNCVKLVVWPARYPECIAVAGCNQYRKAWKGSCRGDSVDITAPAEQVWHASAKDPRNYKDGQGTSFAVALTAGAAAQWLAHHGIDQVRETAIARGVTVQDLFRTALQQTAEKSSHLDTDKFGPGIVNVEALLKLDLSAIGTVTPTPEKAGDDPGDEVPPEYREIFEKFGGGAESPTPGFDWLRYGAEMGRVALTRAVSAQIDGDLDPEGNRGGLVESAAAPSSPQARLAAEASGNEALQGWLGTYRS